MTWGEFILAFAVFLATHALPTRPGVRPWLVARLGIGGFLAAYSALSLAALAWLLGAAARAPHVPLWSWAPWQNLVPLVAMLPVCLVIALAVGRPNPFSFGGSGNDRFDPARPGIVGLARHPLLLALAFWAGAHVVPNGDLAHVLLFASFAAFALLGGRIIDRRRRREMGADWAALDQARRGALWPASWPAAGLRTGVGLALYAGLIWLHPVLFGVSPLS